MKMAHVELASSGCLFGAVRDAINRHRARTTDSLAAIVVKSHGFFALLHQVLGESIKHLEEGRTFGNIFDTVSFKSARAVRAFLAPNFKSEIHCLFHLVNRFGLFVTAGGKFHILVDE